MGGKGKAMKIGETWAPARGHSDGLKCGTLLFKHVQRAQSTKLPAFTRQPSTQPPLTPFLSKHSGRSGLPGIPRTGF